MFGGLQPIARRSSLTYRHSSSFQSKHFGGCMNRFIGRALLAAFAALMGACSQSNGDISRVQPNVVSKRDLLDGQWYLRNTVVWAPPTTGFTFTGETGTLEKVICEIN